MSVFVVVNNVAEIGPRQTTAMLIAAFIRAGQDVWLVGVGDLSASNSSQQQYVAARGLPVPGDVTSPEAVAEFSISADGTQLDAVDVASGDVIVIRTNPGRDTNNASVHSRFMSICRVAEGRGLNVVNSPRHLEFFASKASLLNVDPKYCPATLLSSDVQKLCQFVVSHGECVLKPTVGSRGEGVVRLHSQMDDLTASVAKAVANTEVVVQEFLTQAIPGDKRVVVLDGEVLEIDGHPAGIERRPAEGDFRGNLHAGGTAHQLTLNADEREAATWGAKLLFENGIRLAGIDLVDAKIIEFNVFSTGGLFDAERFTGCRFADAIVQRIA